MNARPVRAPLRATTITTTAAMALFATGVAALATPAAAATRPVEIQATVLVLDDGQPMVGAIVDRLSKEGVAYQKVDLTSASRPQLTPSFFASQGSLTTRAKFMGVVTPSAEPASLSDAERATLARYETTFKVREFSAYNWPSAGIGLENQYSGAVDGMTGDLSGAAKTNGFDYLKGSVTFDDLSPSVAESYGYIAKTAALSDGATYTPYLTLPVPGTGNSGSLLGVYAKGGREQLISTVASNASQQHWKVLSHGIVSWLTRGISTSYSRNFFAVQVDDVLLPDAEWNAEGNCTVGDDCNPATYPETAPGATSRMAAQDVDQLAAWQRTNGVKLDVAFNGAGAADQKAETGSDALEASLLANKNEFRWINHTWSHPYLGCVHDDSMTPWQCAKTSTGGINWASQATIASEISKNVAYAKTNTLPNFDAASLVTGEHSGLKSLPQMPADNPYLASALTQQRIKWIASDASRESEPRVLGSATTVPRHPMNIYYNTSTKANAVDEYNWLYTSRADGGSGLCEDNPATSTCITPLTQDGFDSYIVPKEKQIALGHVLDNDARPHYAHQSNLTGDRILYPVVEGILGSYRGVYADNAPIVNVTTAEAGTQLVRQQTWRARSSQVQATISGTKLQLFNNSFSAIDVPVTTPSGTRSGLSTFGQSYGGQSSDWVRLSGLGLKTFTLPTATGFATSASWDTSAAATPATPSAPALTPGTAKDGTSTRVIAQPVADSDLIAAAG